ncbi:MAG: ANTAR domain-containing protein [Planctomycetota bacterium]|jgi:DNA-binding response OmpR family regulator
MRNTGIVLAFEGQEIHPAIRRSAEEHGWPVVRVPNVRAAMRDVLRQRAPIVIVQIDSDAGPSIHVIHRLRRSWHRVVPVALVTSADEELERSVRAAGATCYLVCADEIDVVEKAKASAARARSRSPNGQHASPFLLSLSPSLSTRSACEQRAEAISPSAEATRATAPRPPPRRPSDADEPGGTDPGSPPNRHPAQ